VAFHFLPTLKVINAGHRHMKIAVYTYRVWTHDRGAYVIHERMATRQFIHRAGGEVYEKSEKFVDESRVAADGEEIIDPKSN
jgi:hypothetical protein